MSWVAVRFLFYFWMNENFITTNQRITLHQSSWNSSHQATKAKSITKISQNKAHRKEKLLLAIQQQNYTTQRKQLQKEPHTSRNQNHQKPQTSIPRKLLNSNRTPRTKNNSKPDLLGKLQPAIKNQNAWIQLSLKENQIQNQNKNHNTNQTDM
jgi:hypothetical protein